MSATTLMPEALDLHYHIAEPDDLEGLAALYATFFEESVLPSLGLRFDIERCRQWLGRAIPAASPIQMLAVDGPLVVAVLGWFYDHTGTVEPFAVLDKFYVLKNWRRTRVGSTLLGLALDIAKSEGAVAFRAGLSGGIRGGDKLFAAAGFEETPHEFLFARRL